MQSVRASKRRKLDQDDSAKSSPSSRQPLTSAKKEKQQAQSAAKAGPAQNGAKKTEIPESEDEVDADIVGLSTSELWLRAKAKAINNRGKRTKAGAHDDIDGGNVGKEPNGRMPVAKAPKPKTAPLNFFKQFAKPKGRPSVKKVVETEDEEDYDELDGDSEKSSEEDEEDGEASEIESGKPVKLTSRSGKYWAKGGQGKKTFEDEIREVEEAARKHATAGDSGSEDELANAGNLRRSSSRNGSIRKSADGQQNGRKIEASQARKANGPQPLDRRKVRRAKAAVLEDNASDDEMEIDDSNDEGAESSVDVVHVKPLSTPQKPKSQSVRKTASTLRIPAFEECHLQIIQKILLEKCTGKRPIPLTNLSDEYAKVSSLITQTITAGESNSMLLIGARGSGKTTLLNHILREQSIKHPDDYHIVRLSGFIHTDDKIALREIWRQLGREMEIEDSETSKNYADTLTTLLALLSHPAETGRDEEGHVTKSVIFILDEFELFATHPRQTLLYNLFDIAQSRKAPIAVLGCTTRIDVAESLEKRVKSRFSHRYVHLSMSKSLQAFELVCRSAMNISVNELYDDEKAEFGLASPGLVEKLQKAALSSGAKSGANGEKEKQATGPSIQWNALVDAVISSEPFTLFLARLYHTTKSIPEFLSALLIAMATLPISETTDSSNLLQHLTDTIASHPLHPPDSKLSILESLSSLQLALLICAARLTNIYNSEIISFALAYEEYKNLASKAKLQASASGALAQGAGSRVWGKAVAKGAWEGLVECGLVLEDGRGGRVDVGMEEIGGSGVELGGWGRWCREI